MKLLVSLTCFESQYHGTVGFSRWIDYYGPLATRLGVDGILLANDGPWLPPDASIQAAAAAKPGAPLRLITFPTHLGRPSVHRLDGWWRSYLALLEEVVRTKVDSFILIEWDFFVLSERLLDNLAYGLDWLANSGQVGQAVSLWSPKYSMPEASLHMMSGKMAEQVLQKLAAVDLRQPCLENTTEFAISWDPARQFVGDRYPEWGEEAPIHADWIGNVPLGTTYRFGSPSPIRLPWIRTAARFEFQGLVDPDSDSQ